jgi:hypothetical protein
MANETSSGTEQEHYYHAEASALQGELQRPLKSPIKPQAYVKLHEEGGYLSERALDYRLEGIFSFRHAYTQVAGNLSLKDGHGHVTLATAVLEGFNVLDVITADRIVSQISTEHPRRGCVPEVTFLGTRFEGLKIAGCPVELKLDTGFLGAKPANDGSYHKDTGFRARVDQQRAAIRGGSNLPDKIGQRYNKLPSEALPEETIEWSLVQQIKGDCPGNPFGHAVDIPHFGRVFFGVVRLQVKLYKTKHGDLAPKTTISLSMVEIEMGCIGHGVSSVGNTITNGGGKGGGN